MSDPATTTTISDSSALWAALKFAHAGDTVLMAPGNYSLLRLDGANIAGGVTVTSLDADHPAVIAGLNITNSSGLTFSNIEVTVDARTGFAIMLGSDSNMRFDHINLHGAAVGDGSAVMVRNSTNVTVSNSDIHDLTTGLNHLNSTGVTFANNTLHDIQADGIRGGGSSNVTITGNHFTNFKPQPADHPDAIQFWTTNTTTAAHDIVITDNVFVRGTGGAIQGIFVGNENQITYQNVTITGNAIIGGMYHGISLTNGANVIVQNNLVEGFRDMTSWIMLNKTINATLTNNQATDYNYNATNTGLTNTGNVHISLANIGDTTALTTWLAGPVQAPITPVFEFSFEPGSQVGTGYWTNQTIPVGLPPTSPDASAMGNGGLLEAAQLHGHFPIVTFAASDFWL